MKKIGFSSRVVKIIILIICLFAFSIKSVDKVHAYENHCWDCGSRISSDFCVRCRDCGWYICRYCGACSYSCSSRDDHYIPPTSTKKEEDTSDDSGLIWLVVIGGAILGVYLYNKWKDN